MNVVFLDIDGVVNTLIWEGTSFSFGDVHRRRVNNFQACKWVSKFCKENDFRIVVSSSWRSEGLEKCAMALRAGGIDESIPIVDVTPRIRDGQRGDEIGAWLKQHPVDHYLIFDDDSDMTVHRDHLIKSNCYVGFTFNEFQMAEKVYDELKKGKK